MRDATIPETKMEPTEKNPIGQPIQGKRVAFVGKLGGINRREARELARKNGAMMLDRVDTSVDLIVIGADVDPFDEPESLVEPWVLEASRDGRVEIVTETQFWQMLGQVDPTSDVNQLYTPSMLARLLDTPITTIRRWHRRGLITPSRQVKKLPYFDFQEVASARRIAQLIATGATPQTIEKKLSKLAELYPNLHRPLSQLSVIVEGKNVLLRQGGGLIEPSGQRRIDFDSFSEPESEDPSIQVLSIDEAVELRSLDELTTKSDFIKVAIEHEDADDAQSAIEVYRALSLAFGPSADVCFRVAELLYQQNDLAGARERYFMSVELDETFVEARASLGCVLVELGDHELALSAFLGALDHHADYPDVHFHLARLLDELERPQEATAHWESFLELAPKSPWAEEARHRLGI